MVLTFGGEHNPVTCTQWSNCCDNLVWDEDILWDAGRLYKIWAESIQACQCVFSPIYAAHIAIISWHERKYCLINIVYILTLCCLSRLVGEPCLSLADFGGMRWYFLVFVFSPSSEEPTALASPRFSLRSNFSINTADIGRGIREGWNERNTIWIMNIYRTE